MAWYAKFDGVDGSGLHKDHKAWCNVASVNMSGHTAGGEGTEVERVGGKMHLEDISLGIITDKKALPNPHRYALRGSVVVIQETTQSWVSADPTLTSIGHHSGGVIGHYGVGRQNHSPGVFAAKTIHYHDSRPRTSMIRSASRHQSASSSKKHRQCARASHNDDIPDISMTQRIGGIEAW